MNMRARQNGKDEQNNDLFAESYINPVYPFSFPDPFVFKFRGEYYGYCTGIWNDGRVFGVIHSRDLVNWRELGGAMTPLDSDAPFYWAPEVTYANGRFYLYYSVGNETLMELRVAVSDRPTGGFVDSGVVLTAEEFAIDAHVFIDDDGQKYLFYATDFLEHTHIGTGTVVDKMLDFFKLAGNPQPVSRPKYEWQLYDPNRKEKGGVRWHTVEGSFVLKRKGKYYQMFSGGNWQNLSYGVSYATTTRVERGDEWDQFSDGERILPILRTVPGLIVGPGHNSVVRGLNNRELYCVYHRWTEAGRVLAIDRMDFAGDRMFVAGATCTDQPFPFRPHMVDYFEDGISPDVWQRTDAWEVSNGEAMNRRLFGSDRDVVGKPVEQHELVCRVKAEMFLSELTFRSGRAPNVKSCFGFCLLDDNRKTIEFLMFPNLLKAIAINFENQKMEKQTFDLPADFDFHAFHLLRVEVDGLNVSVAIDDVVLKFEKAVTGPSRQLALIAENMQAAFSAFALTLGFEDRFEWEDSSLETRGWRSSSAAGDIRVRDGQLEFANRTDNETWIEKGPSCDRFVWSANFRLVEKFGEAAAFGFVLLNEDDRIERHLTIVADENGARLETDDGAPPISLPEGFDATEYHQFTFVKFPETMQLRLEDRLLGELAIPDTRLRVAAFTECAAVSLEMVRLTIFS